VCAGKYHFFDGVGMYQIARSWIEFLGYRMRHRERLAANNDNRYFASSFFILLFDLSLALALPPLAVSIHLSIAFARLVATSRSTDEFEAFVRKYEFVIDPHWLRVFVPRYIACSSLRCRFRFVLFFVFVFLFVFANN
jgi:hypothetical protein